MTFGTPQGGKRPGKIDPASTKTSVRVHTMQIDRRRLLGAAFLLPAAGALGVAGGNALRVLNRAARAMRPAPAGTSATRCAACGGDDHSMLDDACPRRPRVL